MKNIFLSLILLLITYAAQGQTYNTFPSSGNVGIGTTSPASKLHIIHGSGTLRTVDNNDGIILSTYSISKSIGLVASNYGNYSGSGSVGLKLVNGEILFIANGIRTTTFTNNGNVGIGTTNATDRLTLNGNFSLGENNTTATGYGNFLHLRGLSTESDVVWMSRYNVASNATELRVNVGDDGSYTNNVSDKFVIGSTASNTWRPALSVATSGKVGIGTDANVNAALHVLGPMILERTGDNPSLFTSNATSEQNRYLILLNSPTHTSASGLKAGGILVSDSYAYANPGKSDVIVKGSIGIGTPTINSAYKLAVNGSIRAKEVKVEADWADFVFADSYQLPTLEEVEAFIQQHRHLPEIPSEAEVAAEGINLGEMNAKLLQKIEELTLYTIEQEKKINKLEEKDKEVQELRQELDDMKAMLSKLLRE